MNERLGTGPAPLPSGWIGECSHCRSRWSRWLSVLGFCTACEHLRGVRSPLVIKRGVQ